MYSLTQLRRGVAQGLQNPEFFGRELNRLFHRRAYRRPYNSDGIDVMAQDWDVLVVLDACRYDSFKRRNDLPGRLNACQSRGSHTVEFLRGNVAGRDLHDTVYVTASPQLHRNREVMDPGFHAVVNVWRGDGWDETENTVLPETMTGAVRDARERYPQKRLIAHYIQPHYPFIGSKLDAGGERLSGEQGGTDIWARLNNETADIPPERVRAAYERNLEAVLPHIDALRSDLDGRFVVTSDHGNMFGERSFPVPVREWGHPPGIYTPELVRVPWLVSERGGRPTVVSESGRDSARDHKEIASERLRHLGYAE